MIRNITNRFDLYWRNPIDIGTHKGGYLYCMRKRVGQKNNVFCFEPQKPLYEYLKKIKKSYNWSNIFIENAGLGNIKKTMFLKTPGVKGITSPGATFSSNNDLDGEISYKCSVPVYTLDAYFQNISNQNISFIKIDVEGFEKEVLLGANLI